MDVLFFDLMKKIVKNARQLKKEEIEKISEKIARAKTIVFSDYQGISANQMTGLRRKVKEAGGEFLITKNSLLKIALTKNQFEISPDQLDGATATLFSFEDELAPLKQIAESVKTSQLPKYKFGFFGRDALDTVMIETLSKIPGREVLQAKVVGSLASPLYGIVGVLSANIRNLVYALNEIRIQKEEELAAE